MESLQQYIDIARQHSALLEASPGPLAAPRAAALKALEGFAAAPSPRVPFKTLSPEALLAPDYGLNLSRVEFPVDLAQSFRCDIPNLSTLLAIVVNDTFRPTTLLAKNLPQGVTVMSLARAAAEHPGWVEPYYNRLAADSCPGCALNTLLCQDGVLVHLDRGVKCDKILQIVNIFNAVAPILAARRMLVVAEEDAAISILDCDHTQTADVQSLGLGVVEIFAAPGAKVEIYGIEESSQSTRRAQHVFVSQRQGSSVTIHQSTLRGGISANRYDISLLEPHCESFVGGLAIEKAGQCVWSQVTMRHRAPDCRSRQLFKFSLDGDALGAFGGKIIVDHGAVRTDASQTDRNLIQAPGARMYTEPQLEIYCDDVQCSHGAATGELDERALFYMESRGIPRDEARRMLTQAFMTDVVDAVAAPQVRDRLRHLVERRLDGLDSSCADCSVQNNPKCLK